MAKDNKESNYSKLTATEKAEFDKRFGNQSHLPVEERESTKEYWAGAMLLKRGDGTVATLPDTFGGEEKSAVQGKINVSDSKPFPQSRLSQSVLNSSYITTIGGSQPWGGDDLSVDANGFVSKAIPGKFKEFDTGYDCKLTKQTKALVADVMKDGKLTVDEAKHLGEFVSNAPNPKGKNEKCGPTPRR
ncbi:MAG: hypothetical protein V4735_00365 [Pseudomonadota bacterium]